MLDEGRFSRQCDLADFFFQNSHPLGFPEGEGGRSHVALVVYTPSLTLCLRETLTLSLLTTVVHAGYVGHHSGVARCTHVTDPT